MEEIESLHNQIKEVYAELETTQEELKNCLKKLSKFERKYKDETSANKEMRHQLKHLRRKLHKYKKLARKDRVDVETQTWDDMLDRANGWPGDNEGGNLQTAVMCSVGDRTESLPPDQSDEPQSLADSLKAAAEAAMQQTGYTYDDKTGLYYDYNTGYYYDSEKSLYYEPNSGTYYYYDPETESYQFHSQVDVIELEKQYAQYNRQQCSKTNQATGNQPPSKKKGKLKNKKYTPPPSVISADKVDLLPVKENPTIEKKSKPVKENVHSKKKPKLTKENITNKKIPNTAKDSLMTSKQSKPISENTINLTSGRRVNVEESMEAEPESGDSAVVEEGIAVTETASYENVMENDSEGEGEVTGGSEVSELEEGEVASSEEEEEEEEEPVHYPPCIRVIVSESDQLEVGQLFIITCTGATIGREKGLGHLLLIPDLNISKMHCDIKYDEHLMKYIVKDHASQNGTFINGNRLSVTKTLSDAFPVQHLDMLEVGGTKLELHIHAGSDTCDGCEPGQIQAKLQTQQPTTVRQEISVMSKEARENQRRQQLKLIKKKFGLGNSGYVDNAEAINNPNYKDKSSERRQTKGSDNPYQKDDPPASVHRAIAADNKGHKLLAKMGWKEGESLGKSQQGIAEPISVTIRSQQTAGLGALKGYDCSMDNVQGVKNAAILARTKLRYEKSELLTGTDTAQLQRPLTQTTQTKIGQITWRKGQTINAVKDTPRVNLADDSEEEESVNTGDH